jgi:hypothetical protein
MGVLENFVRGLRGEKLADAPGWHDAADFNGFNHDHQQKHEAPKDDPWSIIAGLRGELAALHTELAGVCADAAAILGEKTELLEENASLKAQLANARGPASSERVLAQLHELESILAFPGARRALEMALHPDTGKGGSIATRTEITKTLHAVVERLGIRG